MSTKVYDWGAYHASQSPSRLAMVDLHSGRRFTYADMQARTARLANGLRDRFGIAKGSLSDSSRSSQRYSSTTTSLSMRPTHYSMAARRPRFSS